MPRSDTVRRLARSLGAVDPELVRVTVRYDDGTSEAEFAVAEAVWWVASLYHAGQGDPLYSALCATRYRPGPLARGLSDDTSRAIFRELLRVIRSRIGAIGAIGGAS